jgi:hypothetical protein
MATLRIQTMLVLSVAAFCLQLAGCQDAFMSSTGHTYFAVTTVGGGDDGARSVSTLVSLAGQRVAIVSDCPRQSREPNAPRLVAGAHVTSDGREIPWSCETTDTRTISRISINGAEYRLADGNTFLFSSKGRKVRVLQMQLGDNKILDLDNLRKTNSEANDFFTQSAVDGLTGKGGVGGGEKVSPAARTPDDPTDTPRQ